ncbi:TTC38 [Symbiodinium pilosum]|uniref:Tetratricopeptide repeat protein 38 n=1 Tax=Symbiodinium pilosum TaxID=2952 RepID=A0A812NJW3_SYMPI|nr:TTC38 [Symbiodinium pilosum]
MVADQYGLEVTTTNQACAKAVDSYYEAVLAYRPFRLWSAAADEAMRQDASCPMARVLAADCSFCQGDAAKAKELLEKLGEEAEASSPSWSWRELRYVEAWRHWVLQGDPSGCYVALSEVVSRYPSDLFAVKRGHIMGLILGDGSKMLSIVQPAAENAKSTPPPKYLHGMWSFALEQEGQYKEAERIAWEGFGFEKELGPDAWLDHSLAHSLYFQGVDRLDDAMSFMKERSRTWPKEDLHPFLYTHCWWHLALLYTESGDFEPAIAIFDERLWPEGPEGLSQGGDPQVQLNALNLLWRLETRRQADLAGPRWRRVLEGCRGLSLPKGGAKGTLQHCDLLLDILLIRGLCVTAAQDPQPLDEFLTAVQKHSEEMAAGPGGAGGRAEAYRDLARFVADVFRSDLPDSADAAEKQLKARSGILELKAQWGCLGGSEEQRGILLEAAKGPVVCGNTQVERVAEVSSGGGCHLL